MKVLVAEDSIVQLMQLELCLLEWGYEISSAIDGANAWRMLQEQAAPALAVLDWLMPDPDGPELCRRIRADPRLRSSYVILLTTKNQTADLVEGLEIGADDYVVKTTHQLELRARLRVGERVLALQQGLAERVRDLEAALGRVQELQTLLPMCAKCKRVRTDTDYRQRVEDYITMRMDVRVSHCICPECLGAQPTPGDLAGRGEPRR